MAHDEGIRPSTTMEGLAKLKPAFKEGGCTTAGETGREVGRKGPCPCGCALVAGSHRQGACGRAGPPQPCSEASLPLRFVSRKL